ncbi:uncharacterized protein V1478_014591 [Vespula squamosa]|uniref:DUF4802 domain-containing protein n=1 Tax=Vespula squamosa TaxID=30214 RepID=A0ABD2A2S3_VESSQ
MHEPSDGSCHATRNDAGGCFSSVAVRRTAEGCERPIWVNTKRAEQIRRNHEHVARREAGVEPAVRKEILRECDDVGGSTRKSRRSRGSSKNSMYAYRSGHDVVRIHKQHIRAGPHSGILAGFSREERRELATTSLTRDDDTWTDNRRNRREFFLWKADRDEPEIVRDMDMLQLFASPAGRALLSNDNRPKGSTSTSSLSRESSSRLKSGRRPSGTGTVSAPTSPPRQRKSSAELYKEAVEILGLTCSLTDSCRCIDCQSNYFDCDDDCGDARTELAAGTPILLDHALSHPLTCSIQ